MKILLIMSDDVNETRALASFEIETNWIPMSPDMDMNKFSPSKSVLREIIIEDGKATMRQIVNDFVLHITTDGLNG